jgi:hypothetical protein
MDLKAWNTVATELSAGNNPYQTTTLLNWPPLWLQIIFGLSRIASFIGISLTRAIQLFLIGIESLVLVVTYFCIRRFFSQAPVKKILLFGISLNPILVFQVCQHGNFDILIGLWVVLFIYFILSYYEDKNPIDWLFACFFLGLGIVTKTTPIMLIPVGLFRIRSLPWKTRILGAFLILFPVCLGISFLYALSPEDVVNKVLRYRSASDGFGIPGLLYVIPVWGKALYLYYERISSFGVFVFLALASLFILRYPKNQKQLLWVSVLLFIWLFTFGPGYAPQYVGWFLPLLLLLYALEDNKTRWIFVLILGVGIITYTIEYAFFTHLGAFLLGNNSLPIFKNWSDILSTLPGHILIYLPLFFSYLYLLRIGWDRIKFQQ